MLYEQLLAPQCQQAIQQFEEAQPDSTVSQSFKKALNELQQLHTESMSNVRFLATLERSGQKKFVSLFYSLSCLVRRLLSATRPRAPEIRKERVRFLASAESRLLSLQVFHNVGNEPAWTHG